MRNGDNGIAESESSKLGYGYVFTQLGSIANYQLRDGYWVVFNERLLVKANLCQTALNVCPVLLLVCSLRYIFFPDELRRLSSNLQGKVVYQFPELFATSYKITFANHLKQHADCAIGMRIARNRT